MKVIVPPDGIAVVGAKDSVMGTRDLWEIRSEIEMLSMTDATEVSPATIDGSKTESKIANKKLLV